MSKIRKLYERVKNNPRQVRFEELARLLTAAGFAHRQSGKGSSHHIFYKGQYQISLPYRRPAILLAYVEQVLQLLEKEWGDEDEDA